MQARPISESDASIEADKRALRRRIGALRHTPAVSSIAVARRICEHLVAEPRIRGAATLALYAALPDEVPTRPLFEALAGAGATCLLPLAASDGRLVFCRIERWEDLRPGRFGVLEPPESAPVVATRECGVAIVPGIAFDHCGWRLGRGRGFYDRTFPTGQTPQPLLVGLAAEAQIVESVPHASHDRAMDAIVTERAFQWARGES